MDSSGDIALSGVGAPPDEIENVKRNDSTVDPSTKPRPAESSSDDDNDNIRCVICLDSVSEPCVAQPCGHLHFDFLCLMSWLLQRHPSCPLCKATVATVQYGFANGHWKTFPVPAEDDTPACTPLSTPVTAATPETSRTPFVSHPRRRRERTPSSPSTAIASALDRRRRVYREGLYSLHVGANRLSRYYRELTPRLFVQDPDLVSRARAFIRRELQVLLPDVAAGPSGRGVQPSAKSVRLSSSEFLIEYIIAILKTVDIQDSAGGAENLLQEFLGLDATRLFLHELRNFLRSPFRTLESWDRHVQYGRPQRFPVACEEEAVEREREQEREEEQGEDSLRLSSTAVTSRPRGGDFWRPPPSRASSRRGPERVRGQHPLHSRKAADSVRPRPRPRNNGALREACWRYDPY